MSAEVRRKLKRMLSAHGYELNAYVNVYYCPHDGTAPIYSHIEVHYNPEATLKDFEKFLGIKHVVDEKTECVHTFIKYYGFNKATPEEICSKCGKEK